MKKQGCDRRGAVARPNILYLHCRDTGRYVPPYGCAIPTPNIQKLAEEGVRFRQASCAGPTCSPSQAGYESALAGLRHVVHEPFTDPENIGYDELLTEDDGFDNVPALDIPARVQGRALMPLIRGEKAEIDETVFVEIHYHSLPGGLTDPDVYNASGGRPDDIRTSRL